MLNVRNDLPFGAQRLGYKIKLVMKREYGGSLEFLVFPAENGVRMRRPTLLERTSSFIRSVYRLPSAQWRLVDSIAAL
jgi:hypothetical protein